MVTTGIPEGSVQLQVILIWQGNFQNPTKSPLAKWSLIEPGDRAIVEFDILIPLMKLVSTRTNKRIVMDEGLCAYLWSLYDPPSSVNGSNLTFVTTWLTSPASAHRFSLDHFS